MVNEIDLQCKMLRTHLETRLHSWHFRATWKLEWRRKRHKKAAGTALEGDARLRGHLEWRRGWYARGRRKKRVMDA